MASSLVFFSRHLLHRYFVVTLGFGHIFLGFEMSNKLHFGHPTNSNNYFFEKCVHKPINNISDRLKWIYFNVGSICYLTAVQSEFSRDWELWIYHRSFLGIVIYRWYSPNPWLILIYFLLTSKKKIDICKKVNQHQWRFIRFTRITIADEI